MNHTLAIDSPFQTFAVGLLVKFIDQLYHCFLQRMTQLRLLNSIGKYHHKLTLELALELRALYCHHWQTRRQEESLQNWEKYECEELRLRRGSPLACRVVCFVSSGFKCLFVLINSLVSYVPNLMKDY